MTSTPQSISFQGEKGAYSDLACRTVFPDIKTIPCPTFDEAFRAVHDGLANLAMIPVDNTIAGRVADVHHLLPKGGLFVIAEHFQPVEHCLLAIKSASKEGLKIVHSHVHAIPQCRKMIRRLKLQPQIHADTAGAAREISQKNDPQHAAIASKLAAQIYDLQIIEENVRDEDHNTTRFLILSPDPVTPDQAAKTICSLTFKVRNLPAALYKALGGFATNRLSLCKLESYVDENFQAAQFYCEVEGHPESTPYKLAMEELAFYAKDVKFLGAYPAHAFRNKNPKE